ncbi:GNAT family N-acetyltransferase, partial [Pseudoalteromonas sp. CR1]|uniref:GNAT family N-acetyltransferase n=1 Tax=Pseudoalteromonas sp. CR1 TaxID=2861964 RepID=UPI001C5EF6DE
EGIAERIATFETEPRTVEQLETQLREKGDHFPTVVVERDGEVIAWASVSSYRSRPCYAGIAEHSVYVSRAARGAGAGLVALEALFVAAEQQG